MAGKNTAVLGIYATYTDVETGVDALQDVGFRGTDISVLSRKSWARKISLTENGPSPRREQLREEFQER